VSVNLDLLFVLSIIFVVLFEFLSFAGFSFHMELVFLFELLIL
jgi:hypothetical protein